MGDDKPVWLQLLTCIDQTARARGLHLLSGDVEVIAAGILSVFDLSQKQEGEVVDPDEPHSLWESLGLDCSPDYEI